MIDDGELTTRVRYFLVTSEDPNETRRLGILQDEHGSYRWVEIVAEDEEQAQMRLLSPEEEQLLVVENFGDLADLLTRPWDEED